MKLKFCGAARMVTGSCHMIVFDGGKLLVDCGMRQGSDKKTELGEDNFPFKPNEIDAVLLTHAHIDHSGLLPLLTKGGFKGKIFTTGATAKLATIMLPDSANIQEQEAEYATRKNLRAGKEAVEPMYTQEDVTACLKQFRPVEYGAVTEVMPGVKTRFNDVGHLLGSASVEVWVSEGGKTAKVAFSGDLGRDDRPIIRDPQPVESADYLVMEGTYGDRDHDITTSADKEEELAGALKRGIVRGGNIVIPSFAVGRTQELLFYIKKMLINGNVPGLDRVPVYIDSPLGIEATRVYESCAKGYYDEETVKLAAGGSPFAFDTLRIAKSADESKLINEEKGTNIIISSSGMCDAGRIRHHLKHNLYRADSTVIFAGYQAVGTLGRFLTDGAKKIKLFGETVIVNAAIEQLSGFSGHAGKKELVEWVEEIKEKPKHIFLVHGEDEALESLEAALRGKGYTVEVPEMLQEADLATGELIGAAAPKAEKRSEKELDQLTEHIQLEAKRIVELLTKLQSSSDADKKLKLMLLDADIESLRDKWDDLIN